jgi:WD40 repeat protein
VRFLRRRTSPLRSALVALALWSAWAGIGRTDAAEPSTAPILRIHTDEHSAVILGLALSPDGTQIATSSHDGTVRIWSNPGLDLMRTIHLPVGPGIEGAAYTIAFTPDGKTVATGGWTGSWNGTDGPWCFYVIDLAKGDITHAVCDLPRRVNHLTYSPDGKYLAFALKIGGGIRVYRTSDYTVALEDRSYTETSTWVEFDSAGRLATTSYDGKIRLYGPDFHLIASAAMPDGRKPDSLSFSPDGARIAVGYNEPEGGDPLWPPAVDVISATDLSVQFRPDVHGIDNGALWCVAWSADGKYLYAGGTWQKAGRYPLRRWANGGKGRPLDIALSSSRVLRIRQLPTGGVVVASEVPALAIVGANDRVIAERRPAVADFADIADKLAASRDGLMVQFAFQRGGVNPAWIALAKRRVEPGEAPADAGLTGPQTDHPDLDVRDWDSGYRPTLNGAPLAMRVHDRALALDIASDGKSLLLGTTWQIIRYDATGKVLWATEIPFNARGVVATADRRLVIAALGDGTIRWYALDTGKELLALFAHADGQRWVAWTPSGYFMSSVQGDALIGWQVNRGRDHVADFFSVGRFRDKYYRPDVVTKTLAALDEATAIREADAAAGRTEQQRGVAELLPPVIEILDPPSAITDADLTLKYRVRAPSGAPIEEIQVRSEGRQLGVYDPPALDPGGAATGELELIVPQRDSELLVFARNQFAASEPARVRLHWAGDKVQANQQRKLYVLAVGISDYREPELKLGFAAKDAGDFVAALERQKGRAFSEVVAKTLTNAEATRAAVGDGLAWLGRNVGANDVGMLFLAGHGFDDNAGTYYYLPRDVELAHLAETSVPYADLLAGLKAIAGSAVLFIDTCHAGDVIGRPGHASMDVIGLVSRLGQPSNGVIVYASSTGDQYSVEASIWRNGAFTKAVVEGLDGAAEYRKRSYITTSMLETYVKERVKDLTANRQTPTVNMPLAVPDLLLARVGGG